SISPASSSSKWWNARLNNLHVLPSLHLCTTSPPSLASTLLSSKNSDFRPLTSLFQPSTFGNRSVITNTAPLPPPSPSPSTSPSPPPRRARKEPFTMRSISGVGPPAPAQKSRKV